jgi:hypothetical protein
MKINQLNKMGGGKYLSPVTETIELQGGPCMQDASPNGGLQNLATNDLINELDD